jgi:hypothetical protein
MMIYQLELRLLNKVSGHSRGPYGKPDDESLLCATRNSFSPVLDLHKLEWPDTLHYGNLQNCLVNLL